MVSRSLVMLAAVWTNNASMSSSCCSVTSLIVASLTPPCQAGPLPRDPVVTVWWQCFCDLLRLVHRCGRVSLLKDLIGDIMSLCGPAQVGELIGHDAAFGNRSQHTNSGFAPFQFAAYAVAIGLAEPEVLVVKGAQATANQDSAEPDRGHQRQGHADTGTLAHAALANLVGLDLALLVKDQDADGILLRHARVLQGRGRHVGSCLIVENRQDHGLVRHEYPFLA